MDLEPRYLAFLAASALTAGLGVALARRERGHWPVALLLALGLAADLAQEVVRPLYLGQARPFAGLARAAWHVGQLGFSCYPWAVLAAVVVVIGDRRRPWAVAAAWAAYEVLLVAGYRALGLREHRLGLVYLAAQVAVVVGLGVVAVPWLRRWWRAGRPAPATTEALAVLAAGVEVWLLLGPMLLGEPWSLWKRWARPPYALFYSVAILVQGGALWVARNR